MTIKPVTAESTEHYVKAMYAIVSTPEWWALKPEDAVAIGLMAVGGRANPALLHEWFAIETGAKQGREKSSESLSD